MAGDKKSDANKVIKVDFTGQGKKNSSLAQGVGDSGLDRDKKDLFSRWISEGTVCILFDARQAGVLVPPEFRNRGELRLNFCYNFHIPDFIFNAHVVQATLSFDSGEYFCVVPWKSVYGFQSKELNQGAVWFESFPKDLDQMEVLGFSEEMCEAKEELLGEDLEEAKSDEPNEEKIIKLDFSKK